MQSSWTSVSDEATVVSQVAGIVPRQRLVEEGDDLKLDALTDAIASPTERQRSGLTGGDGEGRL